MSASEKGLRAIDTNVLVRFILADDEQQLASVDRLMEQEEGPFFVSHIVLAELVWVMKTGFRMRKDLLDAAISRIMASPTFEVEREWLVAKALAQFRSGRAGFADYLIGAVAQEAGCRDTVTFDRKLEETPGFTVLE